jgi:hypothetical protein
LERVHGIFDGKGFSLSILGEREAFRPHTKMRTSKYIRIWIKSKMEGRVAPS